MVIDTIAGVEESAHFAVKLHPKTKAQSVCAFYKCWQSLKARRHYLQNSQMTYSTKLVKCSKAIVQKQSTLGFLALIFVCPSVYNLVDTDYHDDLFKMLDISVHSETESQLRAAIGMLDDPVALAAYLGYMGKMEKEYCRFEESPCNNVIAIIDRHFRSDARRFHT